MANVYVPPPCAAEVMRTTATWVARLYGVRVTVIVEGENGESTSVIDRRPPAIAAARAALDELVGIDREIFGGQTTDCADVCTDPDNCKRCKAPQWDKANHSHAGLSFRA